MGFGARASMGPEGLFIARTSGPGTTYWGYHLFTAVYYITLTFTSSLYLNNGACAYHYVLYIHCSLIFINLSSCSDAGAWTDEEAYKIYREKLARLRDLYLGQLGHLKHVLQEKRREFLLQFQNEGGSRLQGVHSVLLCVQLSPLALWVHISTK